MNIGSKLKELRTNFGLSLQQVSEYIGISTDMMSKIERGDRKPTIQNLKRLTICYNLHEDDLFIYYYSEEIYEMLNKMEIKNTILKEVRKKFVDEGYEYRIRNTNPLKPEKVRKKRVTLGGRNRVKGFGYYLRNDKLIKKQRENLIIKGDSYMGSITGGELDSSLTDIEIVGRWNEFFDEYGYRFPEFEKEWRKQYGKPPSQFNRVSTRKNTSDTPLKPIIYQSSLFGSSLNKPKVSGFGEDPTSTEKNY
jgi:transcriptional regulator with XRE-family HTH domain